MDVDFELISIVKRKRAELRYSRKEVAEAISVSVDLYCRFEEGLQQLDVISICRIVLLLRIEPDMIF